MKAKTHILLGFLLSIPVLTACGGSEADTPSGSGVQSFGMNTTQTCGIVSASTDGSLKLSLLGQNSAGMLTLNPEDGATSNGLVAASRDLKVVCFDDKPQGDEISVTSVARMTVTDLSQKCGTVTASAADGSGGSGSFPASFLLGVMSEHTWIELVAEDSATTNILSDIAASGAQACVVADYTSDPGTPVSVRSAAFVSRH